MVELLYVRQSATHAARNMALILMICSSYDHVESRMFL